MKLRETPTSRLSLTLKYDYYVSFCKHVQFIGLVLNQNDFMDQFDRMIHSCIIDKLQDRLSRSSYYPFKDRCLVKEKVTVLIELEEAMAIYLYLPGQSNDPLIGFLNVEIHKILMNKGFIIQS